MNIGKSYIPIWKKSLKQLRSQPMLPWLGLLLVSTLLAFYVQFIFMPSISQRYHSIADIPQLEAIAEFDHRHIWVAMTLVGDFVVVQTEEKKLFRWPANTTEVASLKDFENYLFDKVYERSLISATAVEPGIPLQKLIIAVDERVRYAHLKPVIAVIANAKISNYAFEARMAKSSTVNGAQGG